MLTILQSVQLRDCIKINGTIALVVSYKLIKSNHLVDTHISPILQKLDKSKIGALTKSCNEGLSYSIHVMEPFSCTLCKIFSTKDKNDIKN